MYEGKVARTLGDSIGALANEGPRKASGADEALNRLTDLICRFENFLDGARVRLQPVMNAPIPETGTLKGADKSMPPLYCALHERLDRFEAGVDMLGDIIGRVDL